MHVSSSPGTTWLPVINSHLLTIFHVLSLHPFIIFYPRFQFAVTAWICFDAVWFWWFSSHQSSLKSLFFRPSYGDSGNLFKFQLRFVGIHLSLSRATGVHFRPWSKLPIGLDWLEQLRRCLNKASRKSRKTSENHLKKTVKASRLQSCMVCGLPGLPGPDGSEIVIQQRHRLLHLGLAMLRALNAKKNATAFEKWWSEIWQTGEKLWNMWKNDKMWKLVKKMIVSPLF